MTDPEQPQDARHGPNGASPAPQTGCCGSCAGRGFTNHERCWDCRGTGHDHAIDTLADRIACVLAMAADQHGTHDYDGQAADVLACLQRLGLLMPDAYRAEATS